MSKFHFMLGELYYTDGELEKAIKHTSKAIHFNPNHETPKKLIKLIENSIK